MGQFFGKGSKFNVDLENAEKNQEKYFDLEINASELIVLNCLQ